VHYGTLSADGSPVITSLHDFAACFDDVSNIEMTRHLLSSASVRYRHPDSSRRRPAWSLEVIPQLMSSLGVVLGTEEWGGLRAGDISKTRALIKETIMSLSVRLFWFDIDCLQHQASLGTLDLLKRLDDMMLRVTRKCNPEGKPYKYASTLMKCMNVWRDHAAPAYWERAEVAGLMLSDSVDEMNAMKMRSLIRSELENCAQTGMISRDTWTWVRDLCARWRPDTEALESFNKTVKEEVQKAPHISPALLSSRPINKMAVYSMVYAQQVEHNAGKPAIRKWSLAQGGLFSLCQFVSSGCPGSLEVDIVGPLKHQLYRAFMKEAKSQAMEGLRSALVLGGEGNFNMTLLHFPGGKSRPADPTIRCAQVQRVDPTRQDEIMRAFGTREFATKKAVGHERSRFAHPSHHIVEVEDVLACSVCGMWTRSAVTRGLRTEGHGTAFNGGLLQAPVEGLASRVDNATFSSLRIALMLEDWSAQGARLGVEGEDLQSTLAWVAMRWELEELTWINENVKFFPPQKVFAGLLKKNVIFSVVVDLANLGWPQRRERRISVGVHKSLIVTGVGWDVFGGAFRRQMKATWRHVLCATPEELDSELEWARRRPSSLFRRCVDAATADAQAQGKVFVQDILDNPDRFDQIKRMTNTSAFTDAMSLFELANMLKYMSKGAPRGTVFDLGQSAVKRYTAGTDFATPTVTRNVHMLYSPEIARWLTTKEMLLLQGFPVISEGVLAKGLVEGVRGEAWAVPAVDNGPNGEVLGPETVLLLISHATLVEAANEAFRRQPTSRFVIKTMEGGIVVKIFLPSTPAFALIYLRDLHNQFHLGAGTSFLEKYVQSAEFEKEWVDYMKSNNMVARQMPTSGPNTYLKEYWRWITKFHKDEFTTWQMYKSAKTFMRNLAQRKIYTTWSERVSSECDFAHPALMTADAIFINMEVHDVVMSFQDTIPRAHLDMMLMECLRFSYPVVNMDSSEDFCHETVACVFQNQEPVSAFQVRRTRGGIENKLKILKCPMGGGVAYLEALEASKKRSAAANSCSNGKASKTTASTAETDAGGQKCDGKGPGSQSKGKGKGKKGKSAAEKKKKAAVGKAKAKAKAKGAESKAMDILCEEQISATAEVVVDHGAQGEEDMQVAEEIAGEVEMIQEADSVPELPASPAHPEDADDAVQPVKMKLFSNDLYSIAASVLKHVPETNHDEAAIASMYKEGMFFAFEKQAIDVVDRQSHQSWKSFRGFLMRRLAAKHVSRAPSVQALADMAVESASAQSTGGIGPQQAALAIEAEKKKHLDDVVKEHFDSQLEALKNTDEIAKVSEFMKANNVLFPCNLHPCFTTFAGFVIPKLIEAMSTKFADRAHLEMSDVIVKLADGFSTIRLGEKSHDTICEALPVLLGCQTASAEVKQVVQTCFGTVEAAESHCLFRTDYTLGLLRMVSTMMPPVMHHEALVELRGKLDVAQDMRSDIGAVEIHKKVGAEGDESWSVFWVNLTRSAASKESLSAFVQEQLADYKLKADRALQARADQRRLVVAAANSAHAATGGDDAEEAAADEKKKKLVETVAALKSISDCHKGHAQLCRELMRGPAWNEAGQSALAVPAIPDKSVTCVMEALLKFIEFKLLENASLGLRMGCDRGYDVLFYDESRKDSRLFFQSEEADPALTLNFCGPVSLIPTVGSFVIGTFDGRKLYLRSSMPNKGPVIGLFSPAWLARVVSYNEDTGEPLEDASTIMKTNTFTLNFGWAESHLADEKSVKSKGPFEITRGWPDSDAHYEEVFKMPQEASKYSSAVAARMKELRPAKEVRGPPRDWLEQATAPGMPCGIAQMPRRLQASRGSGGVAARRSPLRGPAAQSQSTTDCISKL
ncbi:unnamed protein product, partial [Prorocentrum cordatum]